MQIRNHQYNSSGLVVGKETGAVRRAVSSGTVPWSSYVFAAEQRVTSVHLKHLQNGVMRRRPKLFRPASGFAGQAVNHGLHRLHLQA